MTPGFIKATEPPAVGKRKILSRMKARLFPTPRDALINIAGLSVFAFIFWFFIEWAFLNSVWRAADADRCSAASGACWSVIEARWRLIFFGLYPFEQQWRSALACFCIVIVGGLSCIPVFWSALRIAVLWSTGFAAFFILMYGGIFGLSVITTEQWGGLALTVFVFASVVIIGLPLSIVLAFSRRSKLRLVRWLSGGLIDTIRSFPLLSVLFTAAVVIPFVLPGWFQGDKLVRVIIAFSLYFACYQAEIVRGGLQAVPIGQEEAAKSLGIKFLHRVFYILIPQVFRNCLPATINQFVVTFKETSLIAIIGFFDLLAAANAAFGTGQWIHTYVEVYVFVGFVYFIFVFWLSRYGAYLERRMRVGLG